MKEERKQTLKVSKYFKSLTLPGEKEGFIFHSLYGNGMIASIELISMLKKASAGGMVHEDRCASFPPELLDHLSKKKILVNEGCDEDVGINSSEVEDLSRNIEHLRLCISEGCNMKCTYCYMDCGVKPVPMPFDTARRAIVYFFRLLKKQNRWGKITFFGGEPLLNWECLKRSLLLIGRLDPQKKHIVRAGVATNGTLIDDVKARFLSKHDVDVGVSIDGPQPVNDRARTMHDGSSSYERLVRGIDILRRHGLKKLSLSCTVGDHNIDVLKEVVAYAAETEALFKTLEPESEVSKPQRQGNNDADGAAVENAGKSTFDLSEKRWPTEGALGKDVVGSGKFYVRSFATHLCFHHAQTDPPSLCPCEPPCGAP